MSEIIIDNKHHAVSDAIPRENGIRGDQEQYSEYYGDALPVLEDAYGWLMMILHDCSIQLGIGEEPGVEPVEYINGRIKDPASVMGKLSHDASIDRIVSNNASNGVLNGAPNDARGDEHADGDKNDGKTGDTSAGMIAHMSGDTSAGTALTALHDVIGVRVVCSFTDDAYRAVGIVRSLVQRRGGQVIEERDYIKHPKPSGYRSYHLIVEVPDRLTADAPGWVPRSIRAEVQVRTIAMDAWSSLEHQINYKKNVRDADGSIHALLRKCADQIASSDSTMMLLKNAILEQENEE